MLASFLVDLEETILISFFVTSEQGRFVVRGILGSILF